MSQQENEFSITRNGTAWLRLRTACATRLLPLLLLLALPAVVQAQDYTYEVNNGTIYITQYTGSGGAVTIPSTINGLPVTSIGYGAFWSCIRLTSVTIGNNVTSIGYEAFYGCTSLTNVLIPNSVTSIGDGAFCNCTHLASVTIPSSVTIIWNQAFSSCIRLTNVTISNGVTSICTGAFAGCTRLTSVTIPKSVTSIGDQAFYGCTSLTNVTVDAFNSFYSSLDGVLFNKSQTMLIQCPGGKGSVTIPNSVISIGDWAFFSCSSLTNLTIPNSVNSIGDWAFFSCSSLTNLTIPNSVTSIGVYGFYYCSNLTSITIPSSVTSIGDCAFYFCYSLTGVYFKGDVPSIGRDVFYGDTLATVYYLADAWGWGATFAGRPAMLWNPQVQTSGAIFGVRTNQFGFTVTGTSGLTIVVEACTDLANPTWSPVGTYTLTSGSPYFSDPQWTNYPARFYRLRSP